MRCGWEKSHLTSDSVVVTFSICVFQDLLNFSFFSRMETKKQGTGRFICLFSFTLNEKLSHDIKVWWNQTIEFIRFDSPCVRIDFRSFSSTLSQVCRKVSDTGIQVDIKCTGGNPSYHFEFFFFFFRKVSNMLLQGDSYDERKTYDTDLFLVYLHRVFDLIGICVFLRGYSYLCLWTRL